jgi:hypothetical protein
LDQNEYATIMEADLEQAIVDEQLRGEVVGELMQGRELSSSDGAMSWSGELTEQVAAALYVLIGRQWPPAEPQASSSPDQPSEAQALDTTVSETNQLSEDPGLKLGVTESVWLAFTSQEAKQIQRLLDERERVGDDGLHERLHADDRELLTRVKRQWHTRNRYPTHHTPWQAKRANLDGDVVEVLEQLVGRKSPSRAHE